MDEERKRKEKKRDKQRTEKSESSFVRANANAIEAQESDRIAKRKKLVLPTPQVGESELEEASLRQGPGYGSAR